MTPEDDPVAGYELRSFGRKRGRKPSPRQARLLDEVLPRFAVDLSAPFFSLSPSGPSLSSHGSAMTPERGEGRGEGQPQTPDQSAFRDPASAPHPNPLPIRVTDAMGRGDDLHAPSGRLPGGRSESANIVDLSAPSGRLPGGRSESANIVDLSAPSGRLPGGESEGANKKVWLEIGFGGAEHLIWQADHNRDVTVIGCEPFIDGVVKALSQIEDKNLTNVRLLADDVRPLLRALSPESLDRVFILFPDPWPKKKHVKRRLVSKPLLDLLARVMKPGAELRIGTDIGDYARTMLMAFQQTPEFIWTASSPEDWRNRPADWPQTRYEAKAIREGRKAYFLRFVRGVEKAGPILQSRPSA